MNSCLLCNKEKCRDLDGAKLHTTKCNHTFHLNCLQKKWQDTSIFSCPICSENIGLVVNESENHAYIVFESDGKYQCVYDIFDTRVEPTNTKLSKWKRIENSRLIKRKPSVLLQPIIVS